MARKPLVEGVRSSPGLLERELDALGLPLPRSTMRQGPVNAPNPRRGNPRGPCPLWASAAG